jgi:hypothetical protein
MNGLYHWHTPFVVAFLAFVLVFVAAQWRGPGAGGHGPGRRG